MDNNGHGNGVMVITIIVLAACFPMLWALWFGLGALLADFFGPMGLLVGIVTLGTFYATK